MTKNIRPYLSLFIFIFILLVPAMDRKLHFLPVYEATEKRDLAPRPVYSLTNPIPTTIKAFESYWNDNFGGRSLLIHARAAIWIKLFGESPVPYVTIGKNGWLFYKSEAKNDGPGINDYQGLTPLSDQEIKEVVSSIEDIKTRLAEQGIDLVVTVAPNKSTIYTDHLPSYIRQIRNISRLDQIKAALPSDINFVDLRSVLTDSRSTLPTYQSTDSHWNTYGAYLASSKLLSAMPHSLHLAPSELSNYQLVSSEVKGEGDLASMMAARGIFNETAISLISKKLPELKPKKYATDRDLYAVSVYTQRNKKLPRLAVFGDSFGEYLGPFLSPHFSSSYIISFANNYQIDDHLIEQASPNVVIWEVAERYVDRLKQ